MTSFHMVPITHKKPPPCTCSFVIFCPEISLFNSQVIFVLLCLPAITKVIDISSQGAIWFSEVIVRVSIVVPTETTHLVMVGAGEQRVAAC